MENKNDKLSNILFISSFGVIFIILLAFVLITIFEPFDKKKISQLPETSIEECLKEKGNSDNKYYCLIYTKDDVDNEFITEVVLAYYKAAKKDSSLLPIYVMEYSKQDAEKVAELLETVDADDKLPYMFIVNKTAVSTKFNTSSKINTELTAAMNK